MTPKEVLTALEALNDKSGALLRCIVGQSLAAIEEMLASTTTYLNARSMPNACYVKDKKPTSTTCFHALYCGRARAAPRGSEGLEAAQGQHEPRGAQGES